MWHRKKHRFEVGDRVNWAVGCNERWPVIIVQKSRALGWLPSYTVGFELEEVTIFGVLDCQLRKNVREEPK